MKKLLLIALLCSKALWAEYQYPADISYMVADLKYSKEHGLKICEIQHGILSTLIGDTMLNGENGLIPPQVIDVFKQFPAKKWSYTPQISCQSLLNVINNALDWKKAATFDLLMNDYEFAQTARKAPLDPSNVATYHGMLYVKPLTFTNYEQFQQSHPGILLIDAATHPYWIDKYKMTRLFASAPELAQVKPEWGLYAKVYTDMLAEQIQNDIGGDIFVIKPRGAFLGNGVIITSKEDLDHTLQYILNKSPALAADPDKSYRHWNKDSFDSFLVERYYPSDLIHVAEHDNKLFEPTMRAAFILIYNNHKIEFKFLGGYWLLPFKSVDEEGTLNERKKAYCKIPYFTQASESVLQEVQKSMEASIPVLYQQMLERK